MKVCLDMTPLMNSSRFRGIGIYCRGLLRALARSRDLLDGIDLHLMLSPDGRSIRVERCTEEHIEAMSGSAPGPLLSHNLYYLIKHTVAWARLSLSRQDLYHSMEPKGTTRPPGCPVVVTCHDFIPVMISSRWDPPYRVKAAVEWLRFLGIRHAIAISEHTRADLQRITGLSGGQITVVHHGVDPSFSPVEEDPGEAARVAAAIGSDRPYFLYVGGFDRRKQVPGLVESFCRNASGMDQSLVLCGYMSRSERRLVERALARCGARERVLLPGFVPASLLPALYRHATAHVFASSYEGFGMTLTEAFACGCPVIALEVSCIPEVAGGAALLVPPGDLDLMGEEMVRLAADPGLRGSLRARGLERARHFTWDRCAAETVAVYRKVLARG